MAAASKTALYSIHNDHACENVPCFARSSPKFCVNVRNFHSGGSAARSLKAGTKKIDAYYGQVSRYIMILKKAFDKKIF